MVYNKYSTALILTHFVNFLHWLATQKGYSCIFDGLFDLTFCMNNLFLVSEICWFFLILDIPLVLIHVAYRSWINRTMHIYFFLLLLFMFSSWTIEWVLEFMFIMSIITTYGNAKSGIFMLKAIFSEFQKFRNSLCCLFLCSQTHSVKIDGIILFIFIYDNVYTFIFHINLFLMTLKDSKVKPVILLCFLQRITEYR